MSTQKFILPQFPLSIVTFPGEKVNLHIFEPRYRQLINTCQQEGSKFGVPPFNNGQLIFFGTEMEILEVSKVYDDGKMDIKTIGRRVYQVNKFFKKFEDKLYPAAAVTFLEDDDDNDLSEKENILSMLYELFQVLSIKKEVRDFEANFNSYSIAHHVGLSQDEKIKLLTIRSENHRLLFIKRHLEQFLPTVKKAEKLKERAALNGHFKNLKSPDF